MGEQTTNIRYNLGSMARRPDLRRDDVLSERDLKELQRRLALLSPQHVEDFYREAHRSCCLQEGRFPSARSVQGLVQAWKQMRKWR
jgi:hypothetical protein